MQGLGSPYALARMKAGKNLRKRNPFLLLFGIQTFQSVAAEKNTFSACSPRHLSQARLRQIFSFPPMRPARAVSILSTRNA
jgi:hypothetical protein